MPFRSQAQMRFLFAKHPKIAQEFADKTPNISKLPERSGRGLRKVAMQEEAKRVMTGKV